MDKSIIYNLIGYASYTEDFLKGGLMVAAVYILKG